MDQNASTTDDGTDTATDKAIVGSLIASMEGNTNLSDDQLKDLETVKGLYESEDYRQALDLYLNSSLNK